MSDVNRETTSLYLLGPGLDPPDVAFHAGHDLSRGQKNIECRDEFESQLFGLCNVRRHGLQSLKLHASFWDASLSFWRDEQEL